MGWGICGLFRVSFIDFSNVVSYHKVKFFIPETGEELVRVLAEINLKFLIIEFAEKTPAIIIPTTRMTIDNSIREKAVLLLM